MRLDKLSDWPSKKATQMLLVFSLVIFFVSSFILNYFHALSNDPVSNIFESQLSFSGNFMKWQYASMGAGISYYRWVAITDYAFMVGYGLLIFCLALSIARKFQINSKWCQVGYFMAIFGILAACLDAVENALILAMLTDPDGFADVLAIAHSSFALVKWTLGFLSVSYIIAATFYNLIIYRDKTY